MNGINYCLCLLTVTFFKFLIPVAKAQTPNWSWVKKSGLQGTAVSFTAGEDLNGNIIAVGLHRDSVKLGFQTFYSGPSSKLLIAKHNSNGDPIWIQTATGDSTSSAQAVACDMLGNIYVAGVYLGSTLNFGSVVLPNLGEEDFFLAKYTADGDLQWAKAIGGIGREMFPNLCIDKGGNIVLSGWFDSPTITLNPGTTVVNSGEDDILAAKFNSAGNLIWARSYGGSSYEEGSITASPDGGYVLTGYFFSSDFQLGNTTISSVGSSDMFVARLDADGNAIWAKSYGS